MSYLTRDAILAKGPIAKVDPMHITVERLDDKSCKLICIPAHNHVIEAIMRIPDEYEGLKVKEVVIKQNPDDWHFQLFRLYDLELDCSNAKIRIVGEQYGRPITLYGVSGFGKNNNVILENQVKVFFDLISNANRFDIRGNVGGHIEQEYRGSLLDYEYKITKINNDGTIDIELSSHNGDKFIYNELNLPTEILGMKVKKISINRKSLQFTYNDTIKINGSNQTICFNGGKFYNIENHGKQNTITFNSASFESYKPSPHKEIVYMNDSKASRFNSTPEDIVQIYKSDITFSNFKGSTLTVTNSTLRNTDISGQKSLVVFVKSKLGSLGLYNYKKTSGQDEVKTNTVITTDTTIRRLELEEGFQILSNKKLKSSALNTGLKYDGVPDDYHTRLSISKNSTHPYRYYATQPKNN